MPKKIAPPRPPVDLLLHGVGPAWPELCRCGWCTGTDLPVDGRSNTSGSLVVGGVDSPLAHLLIDFGTGTHASLHRANLPMPAAVLLTHGHVDHLNIMEIDTICRARRPLSGSIRRLPVFATATTLAMLPAYLSQQLECLPIEAGQSCTVPGLDIEMHIHAVDASDHFGGAVNYVVEIPTSSYRLGWLLDRKDYGSLNEPDHTRLEGLSVAVLDCDSVLPMSERTGHASLADALMFLRKLRVPPRLSLVTHYNCHGDVAHDGVGHLVPPTMGSFVAHLRALTSLPLVMGYKGMVVRSTFLAKANPVALLHDATNKVIGVAEKVDAHERGLLHASTLLLPVQHRRIWVMRRHARQSNPKRLDCAGGHQKPDESPAEAALREAREELHLTADRHRVLIEADQLVPIGAPFSLESLHPHNRERASLFTVRIGPSLQFAAVDSLDDGEEVTLEAELKSLDDLLHHFGDNPDGYADGLARVLALAIADAAFLRSLQALIEA